MREVLQRLLGKKGTAVRQEQVLIGTAVAGMVLVAMLFFVPFCRDSAGAMIPASVLSGGIEVLIVFGVLFVCAAVQLFLLLGAIRRFSLVAVRRVVSFGVAVTGLYFVAGIIFCNIRNSQGYLYTRGTPFPLILAIAVALVFAVAARDMEAPIRRTKAGTLARVELFIYGLLATVFTVFCALGDILYVEFYGNMIFDDIHINGIDFLSTYNRLNGGFQMVSFVLIAVLTVMAALLVASLVSFISDSRYFGRLATLQLMAAAMCSLIIGLFGKYYEVVQKLNYDSMVELLRELVDFLDADLNFKATSTSLLWFVAVMLVVAVALLRRPTAQLGLSEGTAPVAGGTVSAGQVRTADPCPAFSELDDSFDRIRRQVADKQEHGFSAPTLPELVRFVVAYARDSRLHLYYTEKDIAAFVAGLGTTRLSILQGMSGTGKTSLPKIFCEAIMGNCDIVEVESSWRDKNELLGYYNEFTRVYTPKKFTLALYRAALTPAVPTLIVLDEMNLSRVEYYFSDFLSLMENEEDRREIKLVGTGLFRDGGGEALSYHGLKDGHTLPIPGNVWFVGTANRDESTFEISDKVYDRAHTMNFNKRAPRQMSFGEPMEPRFLSTAALTRLLDEARASVPFDMDSYPVIGKVEALLEPYNISFGNRVARQIESFVRIYCACFAPSEHVMAEAVETILLSKVVSKLEFKRVEDRDGLADAFRALSLDRCADFIMKLGED